MRHYRGAYPALFFVLLSFASKAQAPPTTLPASAAASAKYPSTVEGLSQLLSDVVGAARAGDYDRVDQMVHDMEIPNYEQWFTEVLGQSSWAEAYKGQVSAKNFGIRLKSGLEGVAHRNGAIVVEKLAIGPMKDKGGKPLNAWDVSWRDIGGSLTSEPVWREPFVFVDGGWRWFSTVRRPVFSFPPGLRPIHIALPKYPYPPDGRHPGGIVRLTFVVHADGITDDIKPSGSVESSTDPKLIHAAIDAIRDCRFMPTSKFAPKELRVQDTGILVRPEEAIGPPKP